MRLSELSHETSLRRHWRRGCKKERERHTKCESHTHLQSRFDIRLLTSRLGRSQETTELSPSPVGRGRGRSPARRSSQSPKHKTPPLWCLELEFYLPVFVLTLGPRPSPADQTSLGTDYRLRKTPSSSYDNDGKKDGGIPRKSVTTRPRSNETESSRLTIQESLRRLTNNLCR